MILLKHMKTTLVTHVAKTAFEQKWESRY